VSRIDQAAARMAKTGRVETKDDFWKTADEYRAKFKDLPTVVGVLTPENRDKATEVLRTAIENKKHLSDAEWYKALGIKAPPTGALM